MRQVTHLGVALFICLGLAGPASAASLAVSADKPTYLVGETITLTVTGIRGGLDLDNQIWGRLVYDAALTSTVSSTQTLHTTLLVPWFSLGLSTGDGFADVFHQTSLALPSLVDQNQSATATLVADAVGLVTVAWDTAGPESLDFFGLTNTSGTSFTIVPEPGTGLLVAGGLAALTWSGRRRRIAAGRERA